MKRTTIFLPDQLHQRLRREAFQAGISMAELIRRRLEGRGKHRSRAKQEESHLDRVIGIFHDGTLSSRIDEELYGR